MTEPKNALDFSRQYFDTFPRLKGIDYEAIQRRIDAAPAPTDEQIRDRRQRDAVKDALFVMRYGAGPAKLSQLRLRSLPEEEA